MRKSQIATLIVVTAVASLSLIPATMSSASAACKPVKASGKTVGQVSVGSTSMQIKSFNYPRSGVMEPQKTTLAAGLSERHMPLSSKVGTSVVVWHRDYQGCTNSLNVFMAKKAGDTFTLTDENGVKTKYRLNKVGVITKGDYKKSWFTLVGPRQVVMFTCTGVFKSGHYEQNMVFVAVPA